MKTSLRFIVFLCLAGSTAFGQRVLLSPDSSKILFPNNVFVTLHAHGDGKQFLINNNALQILLVQSNYLTDRANQVSEANAIFEQEIKVRDSIIHVLNKKIAASQERALTYSEAFEKSRLISSDYEKLTGELLKDVSSSHTVSRKNKRKYVVRGVASGLVAGVLISAIYVVMND